MPRFDIAHIREQGQQMIIVPLNHEFGMKSAEDQSGTISALQACARAAGLAGTVVPVWDGGAGRMSFIAPRQWHPFFGSINLAIVSQSLNRSLTCSG